MAKKKALTREEILSRAKTRELELPELGGVVYVRSMPWPLQARFLDARAEAGVENGALTKADSRVLAQRVLEDFVPDIMLYCVLDEKGARVMQDEQAVDDVLASVTADTVLAVVNAVFEYSGLTEKGAAEIEGN